MSLIPEWAPNLHPLLVHFPIVLFLTALLAELLAFFQKRWSWLRRSAVGLYVLAGVSAVLTYWTGTLAADGISVAASAEHALSEHADLGWWTMVVAAAFGAARLAAELYAPTRTWKPARALFLVAGVGGALLIWNTAEHGAQLVYRYGVGVQEAEQASTEPVPSGLSAGPDGWTWRPRTARAWIDTMSWPRGKPDTLRASLDTLDTGSVALRLSAPKEGRLFTASNPLAPVQVSAELNVDGFDGTVALVHHFRGPATYDFLSLTEGEIRQGRVIEGDSTIFQRASVSPSGWFSLRAVGDGTHFRGYVNGEMVVHGHGDAAEPGTAGLWIEGSGDLLVQEMRAQRLP